MALKEEAATNAGTQKQQSQQQQHQHQPEPDFNLGGIDDLLGVPTTIGGEGDVLLAYVEQLEACFRGDANISKKFDDIYHLLPLGRATTGLTVDAVAIIAQLNSNVYVYPLILAATMPAKASRTEFSHGQTHECALVAGDMYNQEFFSELNRAVSGSFEGDIVQVGYTVIPAQTKPENVPAIRKMMGNAVISCALRANKDAGKSGIKAKDIGARGGLKTNLRITKEGVVGMNGLPNRTDFTCELGIKGQGRQQNQWGMQQQQQPTRQVRPQDLVRMAGYVDLVYSPAVPAQNINPYMQQQQVDTRSYLPRFVISNLEQMGSANSLELMLMGLSSSVLAIQNNNWMHAFKRSYGDRVATNLHDIGAIGLEVNVMGKEETAGKKLNTKSNSFTDQDLFALLTATCRDQVLVALDVEIGGTQTWLQSVLARTMRHDEEGALARQQIVEAADNITNGAFSQIFQGGEFVLPTNEVVHLGTYTDDAGAVRDLRDFDYLAILNNSPAGDLSEVNNWSASFVEHYAGEVQRLEKREEIIKAMCPHCTITGKARRLTLTTPFLHALWMALGQAGLPVVADGGLNQMHGGGRIYQDYSGVGMGASADMFNSAGFQPQGGMGMGAGMNMGMGGTQPGYNSGNTFF